MKASSIEAVGWIFWAVTFVVLLGPAVYGLWLIKYKTTPWLVPFGGGVVLSALAAAVVSWAVNSVLQHRYKRQRIVGRKKARKRG